MQEDEAGKPNFWSFGYILVFRYQNMGEKVERDKSKQVYYNWRHNILISH